jgi:hypothetical protein
VDGGLYVGLRTAWGPLRLEAGSAGPRSCRFPPFGRPAPAPSPEMVIGPTGREVQAKTLPLRMYFFCSECAHLIDLAEGNRPQRDPARCRGTRGLAGDPRHKRIGMNGKRPAGGVMTDEPLAKPAERDGSARVRRIDTQHGVSLPV